MSTKTATIVMAALLALFAVFVVVRFVDSNGGSDDSTPDIWAVEELASSDVSGAVQVAGSLFDDGTGLVLCGALAESFPPQCPGPSIPISNPDGVEAEFTTTGGVRWTDRAVTLDGEMIDGELRVGP